MAIDDDAPIIAIFKLFDNIFAVRFVFIVEIGLSFSVYLFILTKFLFQEQSFEVWVQAAVAERQSRRIQWMRKQHKPIWLSFSLIWDTRNFDELDTLSDFVLQTLQKRYVMFWTSNGYVIFHDHMAYTEFSNTLTNFYFIWLSNWIIRIKLPIGASFWRLWLTTTPVAPTQTNFQISSAI